MSGRIDVSVVVIGRNEGARLERCLRSVAAARWDGLAHEVIYVDSNSSDGSPSRARALGARVLGLGDRRPSAAAGRNVGWRAASGDLVLFLDGDTVLDAGFVASAVGVLADPGIVAVWGHRRETDPRQSVYTRVLDLDWVFPAGPADYFGGDVLVRRAALEAAGGFDDHLVAGEEPELCRRLRAAGWRIEHADLPMTLHDLAIRDARAWWRRAERAGLAYAQVAERFAGTADPLWRRESRRNLVHGTALLLAPALLLLAAALWPALALAALAAGALLWLRSAWRCRWKCPGEPGLALLYAAHSHLQQVPILFGQWRWMRLRRARRMPGLIEYKGAGSGAGGAR